MSTKTVSAVHWSFWAISAVALIWNVMGSINFLMQMNAAALTLFYESHHAIIEGQARLGHSRICNSRFRWCAGLPSAFAQKVSRLLFVYRVATGHNIHIDPWVWHSLFNKQLQPLRDLFGFFNIAGGVGVFDLVFEVD